MDLEVGGIVYISPDDHETIETVERYHMCPVCFNVLGETIGRTGTMYSCGGGYFSGRIIEGCNRRYWIDDENSD